MKLNFKTIACGLAVATMFTACTNNNSEVVTPTAEVSDLVTAGDRNGEVIPGQYIVVLKKTNIDGLRTANSYEMRKTVVKNFAQDLLRKHNISEDVVLRSFGTAVQGFSATLSDEEVKEIAKDANVDFIEADKIISIKRGKPGSGGGGGAQTTPWGITRVGGGASSNGTSWVIDTGIDLDHPDLNVDVARSFTAFTSGKDGKSADDGNGHGTHVAGTIAAIDNSTGVIGVAAGATVVAVKVLSSSGSGSTSGVISGVDYVAANAGNGDSANMSLGGGVSSALDNAVLSMAQSGVRTALAAGNESQHANNSSPARVNHNNIYTVSSMTSSDTFSSFSNYGNPPVDVCAPGSSILSTYKGGGYATLSGTSMAAPHVAGLLLLGNVGTDGKVSGDPDGNADNIAHR